MNRVPKRASSDRVAKVEPFDHGANDRTNVPVLPLWCFLDQRSLLDPRADVEQLFQFAGF